MKNKFLRLGIFGLLISLILGFYPARAAANCHTRFIKAALHARFAKSNPAEWTQSVRRAHNIGRMLVNRFSDDLARQYPGPRAEPAEILPWDIVTGVTSTEPEARALIENRLDLAYAGYSNTPNRNPSDGFVFGVEGKDEVLDFIGRLERGLATTDFVALFGNGSAALVAGSSIAGCLILAEPFEVVREACAAVGPVGKGLLVGGSALVAIASFVTWFVNDYRSEMAHQRSGMRALIEDVRWNLATPQEQFDMDVSKEMKAANGPHRVLPGEILWISMQTKPQGLEIGFRVDKTTGAPALLLVYWPATVNIFNFVRSPLTLVPGTFPRQR